MNDIEKYEEKLKKDCIEEVLAENTVVAAALNSGLAMQFYLAPDTHKSVSLRLRWYSPNNDWQDYALLYFDLESLCFVLPVIPSAVTSKVPIPLTPERQILVFSGAVPQNYKEELKLKLQHFLADAMKVLASLPKDEGDSTTAILASTPDDPVEPCNCPECLKKQEENEDSGGDEEDE